MTPLGLDDTGGDGPALLAVHGAVLSAVPTFGGVLDSWSRWFRVLAVDRPGYDRSAGALDADDPEGLGPRGQAALILDALDAPDVGRPLHGVALGVGAVVLLRMVIDAPAMFSALTLVEPLVAALCPPGMVNVDAYAAAVRRAAPEPASMARAALEGCDPAWWAAAAGPVGRGDPGARVLRTDLLVDDLELDAEACRDALAGPPATRVQVVAGGRSQPAMRTFASCVAAALSAVPRTLDEAGHAAHLHPAFLPVLLEHHDGDA